MTGALLKLEGQKTVDVALDLHPEARRVVIVGGASRADRETEPFARRLIQARARVGDDLAHGETLQRRLIDSPAPCNSVVVFTQLPRRLQAGRRSRAMCFAGSRWPRMPDVRSRRLTFLGLGIVGGDLIRDDHLGERAAESRRPPPERRAGLVHPADRGAESRLMFDWRELRRWGIDEKRLPEGSVVLFREPDFWADHKWEVAGVAGALLGQGLLIGALPRRAAQPPACPGGARRGRTALPHGRRLHHRLGVLDPPGRLLRLHLAVVPRHHRLRCRRLHEPPGPAHRHHRRRRPGALDGASPCAPCRPAPVRLEFRIRTAAGETRWIDHVCAPVVGEDGANLGIRGSNRDITRRRRSEEELRRAFEEIRQLRDRLEADNTYMREQLQLEGGIEGLLATSDVMRYVVSKVQQVAPTSSTVLLQGETGVGKGLVAQAIHDASPRRARPLVTLNCAALPPSLIESELFGHEKGAFTGAHAQRRGRFEIADHSTLFLDEIGELPLDLQAKLLRAVQDGEFERVGGNVTPEDRRAPDRGHEPEARRRGARGPLPGGPLVPPERVPDHRAAAPPAARGHPAAGEPLRREALPDSAEPASPGVEGRMKVLQAHDWPGNVRELENVVERAVISSRGGMLRLGDTEGSRPIGGGVRASRVHPWAGRAAR